MFRFDPYFYPALKQQDGSKRHLRRESLTTARSFASLDEQAKSKGSVLTIDTTSWCYNAGMPRQLRIQYGGAVYHLLSRGDRR